MPTLEGEVTLETFYQALHPNDRKRVRDLWRYELERRLPYELELPLPQTRRDHSLDPCPGSGYYDTAGKPLRMVGVVFDGRIHQGAHREEPNAIPGSSQELCCILVANTADWHTFCRFTRLIGALPSRICGLPASCMKRLSVRFRSGPPINSAT
jgi:hypothetical protein